MSDLNVLFLLCCCNCYKSFPDAVFCWCVKGRCCCWCVKDRFIPYSELWYWFDFVITKWCSYLAHIFIFAASWSQTVLLSFSSVFVSLIICIADNFGCILDVLVIFHFNDFSIPWTGCFFSFIWCLCKMYNLSCLIDSCLFLQNQLEAYTNLLTWYF